MKTLISVAGGLAVASLVHAHGVDSSRAAEETRTPSVPSQSPAFAGQTRAPKPANSEAWNIEIVADGLEHPWAVAPMADGSFLVTERPGRLRLINADGNMGEPIVGVPAVHAKSQGGLLDVTLAPDFARSNQVFLSFAQPVEGDESRTAVAKGTLSADRSALEDVEVIFEMQPAWESRGHFGSRVVFEDDDTLFVTLGDRMNAEPRDQSQNPHNHFGTVVRIQTDGSVPNDNPFADGEAGDPKVWSYGHRNVQAATMHATSGKLWTIEHGAKGGDELNQPEAGKNYGWPTITYGENYNGTPIGEGITAQAGLEQPVYYWDPVIAPSGMTFYTGDRFTAWQGDLFVGGLAARRVVRLTMVDGKVTGEEWLPMPGRARDVAQGPDGALYVVTDEDNGALLRIVPQRES